MLRSDAAAGPLCPVCLLTAVLVPAFAGARARSESLLSYLHIVNVIAEGPRGRVYLAEWAAPERGFAAIKRLHRPAALPPEDAEVRARLLELDHPNIAAVFDIGSDHEGRPYAVTEYVPGKPLVPFCRQSQADIAVRMDLLLELATALDYAQAHGVPHGNLKPSNVLVSDGSARLLDFAAAVPGVARAPEPDATAFAVMARNLIDDSDAASPEIRAIVARTLSDPISRNYRCASDVLAALTSSLRSYLE